MVKTFSVSLLLGLVLVAPLGCATTAPDSEPDPAPEARERADSEVRAELFDELQRAGTLGPQCTKGDFICCSCHGSNCCAVK